MQNLGVRRIGTVRPIRNGGPTLMTSKNLMKKGYGAFDYRSAEGVITVKWCNKCVNLLSNACGIMPLSTVQRWSKAYPPMSITHSYLQSAYGKHRSFWNAGTPVQNPIQFKALVHSSVWIHPWPVHLKFLAGVQQGLWPAEWETNATIILLSTTSEETLHPKTLPTTTQMRCV